MSNNYRGPWICDNSSGTPAAPGGGYIGFGQTNLYGNDSSGPRIYAMTGNPNGVLSAPIGSFYMDDTSGAWYRNTNGATAWQLLTPGSGTLAPWYLLFDSGYLAAPAATVDSGVFVMPTATQHVVFKFVNRSSDAATYDHVNVTLNGDAVAANYQSTREPDDPAVGVLTAPLARLAASQIVGSCPAAGTATATKFGQLMGEIPFNSSTHLRQVITTSADHRAAAGEENIAETTVEWANGAVVTRIAFSLASGGNFVVGTRLMGYAY